MTIGEMIIANPRPSLAEDDCLFVAEDPSNPQIPIVICRADFSAPDLVRRMAEAHPNILHWEVTKEHVTQKEADAIAASKKEVKI